MYIACTNDIICNLVYKILGLVQLCREGVPQLQWPPPVLLTASGANPHFAELEQTRPHLAVAMISAIIKQSSYLCYYCIYVYILAFLKLVPASHPPCLDSPSCYLQKKLTISHISLLLSLCPLSLSHISNRKKCVIPKCY